MSEIESDAAGIMLHCQPEITEFMELLQSYEMGENLFQPDSAFCFHTKVTVMILI